jgi:hypothetical protein
MRVHVNRLDLLAADHDRQFAAARLAAMCARQQAATAEYRAGGHGGRAAFQKMTACVHGNPPEFFWRAWLATTAPWLLRPQIDGRIARLRE